jgi:hypothetical protein
VHKYMGHEHKYMGHETANWGGRGLGYMLLIAHLCNVGSESRDVDAWHANGLYAEDRGLQVPMVLKHDPVTSRGKSAPGPDPRIRYRTQIDMFRPIRMDHTNCLQVAIKTLHSFSTIFPYFISSFIIK